MADPERTKAQRVVAAVGVTLVFVVAIILIGAVLQNSFIKTYLAVPIAVAGGLWFFFKSPGSTKPPEQK